ncbi:cholesterol transport system auxiliary component [Natronospira proteinivora]|uniref:Cholesterol transport system auxiliary component n=1 Tax=Natronospira proteinivora TaxID=1807133 RepID=A0ABT1G914_9GAMM|nr:ABC-type transport auxiliary lipoprotein family protein [Natronospira proteinivora]MCP1727802.1 cholesterol transport system auxiliary component [Natronospira proteinivora]
MNRLQMMMPALLGLLLLSACTILPEQESAPSTHLLEWRGELAPLSKQPFEAIQVAMPSSHPAYDSAHMAYRRDDHELRHYARNQWADKPARLIGAAMAEAISDAGLAQDVAAPGSRVTASHRLDSELIRLEQIFDEQGSHVRLTIRYRLVDATTGERLGGVRHDLVEDSESEDAPGGVAAANRALSRSLEQLIEALPGWRS